MSMLRKLTSIFTMAIAIIAFNTFATAQDEPKNTDKDSVEKSDRKMNRYGRKGKGGKRGRHSKRSRRGNRGFMRMVSRLDLTDGQKSQMKTMLETERTGNQPLREEARTLIMKRRDGTITEDEKTRLGDIKTQMKNSAEQTKNSILALLTPEQTQKFEQMKAERQRRMEERRERRQQKRQKMQSETPTITKEVG